MGHTQAVLEASRKATKEMLIQVKMMDLQIALDSVIGIIEKKGDRK